MVLASHDETKLKRSAGGTSGLVGTRESTEIKVGSPTVMELAKWEGNGYSMKNSTFQGKTDFKLDGKEYTPKGPRVAKRYDCPQASRSMLTPWSSPIS